MIAQHPATAMWAAVAATLAIFLTVTILLKPTVPAVASAVATDEPRRRRCRWSSSPWTPPT